jgi:HK97 family phage portal protein
MPDWNILSRFQRKGGRPPLPRFPTGLTASWDTAAVPQGYEANARAALRQNPVAARAIRLVAEAIGEAPMSITGGIETLLAAPNPRQSRGAFLEALGAHLLLHGNAYVSAAPGTDGRPAELHALRPERVSLELDGAGWPVAYLYRAGTATTRMTADDVLHIRALGPLDDHLGEGCLAAAAAAIATHNAATTWNRALLANAARPSGALVMAGEAPLSAEQFDRLKAEMTAGFEGAANAGRPMLLEGGLRWQALSLSPADMDFAGSHQAAARDIALALGVPPMLLGLPGDNTYANYAEANRALWRLTILPMAGRIAGAMTQWLGSWWPEASLAVDLDRVPALASDREKLWAMVTAADFLSGDEKRRLLGIDP